MNFDIGEIHPNTPHLLCDLIELLILIGYNGKNRLHKNDIEGLFEQGPISHEELDDEERENESVPTSADRNRRRDQQLEEAMLHLEYRIRAFDTWYPFVVEGEELVLCNQLQSKQRVYCALLACSRLRSFKQKGIAQRWAKVFTSISKCALQNLMPTHANVRVFDANSEDRRSYYGTDFRKALTVLGKDLGVLGVNEEQRHATSSSGDGGLDLVATIEFDDGATNNFAIIGQCGAQETEWPKKNLEATSASYRHFFHTQIDFPSIMFTPVCYRSTTGQWKDNKSANAVFLMDRGRIIKLIGIGGHVEKIVQASWFIQFEDEFAKINYS